MVLVLGCGPRARGLLEIRLLLFFVRSWLAASDFGFPNFWDLFCVAMDSFTAELLTYFLHDITGPQPFTCWFNGRYPGPWVGC